MDAPPLPQPANASLGAATASATKKAAPANNAPPQKTRDFACGRWSAPDPPADSMEPRPWQKPSAANTSLALRSLALCAVRRPNTRRATDLTGCPLRARPGRSDSNSELPITTQAPYLLFDWRLAIPEGPQDIHQRKRGRSWRHAVKSVFASDHHRPLMQNVAVELAERLDAHACGRKRRDDFSRRMIPLDGWCLRSRCYGVSIGHAAQPKAFRRREISVEDFGFVGLAKDPLIY